MASKSNYQVTFFVSTDLDAGDREELAEGIIQLMIENAKNGKAPDGSSYPSYSQSYINSLNFKVAGKSASEVDLTLSDEMLNSMELLEHSIGVIKIGYPESSPLIGQVEGNQIGSYGGKPDRSKARPFLGLADRDLRRLEDAILADKPRSVDSLDEYNQERLISRIARKTANKELNDILKRLGIDDED